MGFPVESYDAGRVYLEGSFSSTGASYPKVTGHGFTVTRQAAGHYRITFTGTYDDLVGFVAQIQAATPANAMDITLVTDTYASNVIDVWVYQGSDVAAINTPTYTAQQAATGSITCTAKANYADTDYMTIGDGIQSAKLFEFDTAGDGVTGGRVQVNISGATTAAEVATILAAAINGAGLAITAVADAETVDLTHKIPGAVGIVTMTDNVVNAAHTTSGLAGGVDLVLSFATTAATTRAAHDLAGDETERIHFIAVFRQKGLG